MATIDSNNSFDTILKRLQKIYQQQIENQKVNSDQLNDTTLPELEFNFATGQVLMYDTGNISVKPATSNPYSATGEGVLMPTDINYTWSQNFKLPQQYLGYLGFEISWNVTSPQTLSAGFIYQAQSWSLPVYEIIADGITVWLGQQAPANYMSKLTFAQAQQGAYRGGAWKVTMPVNTPNGGPAKGTYDMIGFIAEGVDINGNGNPIVDPLVPNPTGNYWSGSIFVAGSVTNVDSSGNWTGGGFEIVNLGLTTLAHLESLGPLFGVASFAVTGVWPQPWQNPNDLGPGGGGPGIPAIPGQIVVYEGPSGQAIYQPASDLEFIEAGTLFQGVTYEAAFPNAADFVDAGCTNAGATTAFDQLQDGNFWNDLGGGTFTNNFGSTRTAGDLGLYGVSPTDANIIFQVLWTAYRAGGSPSWAHIGSTTTFGGSIIYPYATFTYNVTRTYPMSNMRFLFLNTTGTPGGEVTYPVGDQATWWGDTPGGQGDSAFLNLVYTTYTQWTYTQVGYRVFYDSALSCPLFIMNQGSSPNIGRPDQHQSLNAFQQLGGSLYDQPGFNSAVCFYWFPYAAVELIVNPDPYPKAVMVNTCCLDNTFDPVFIKQSKSTDDFDIWAVSIYYSAILVAPSVKKDDLTFLKWDDTTNFSFILRSDGYVTVGQEGNDASLDIGVVEHDYSYNDRQGPVDLSSGPSLYSVSIPNTSIHNTQTEINYGAQVDDVTTRVKAYLRAPLNWHKVNKYDTTTQ